MLTRLFATCRQAQEIGDRPWLTGWAREMYTDCLNTALKVGGQYRRMHVPFAEWAQQAGADTVLDLASGGGGPIDTLVRAAHADGRHLPRLTLSDLHPNLSAYRQLQARHGKERIDFIEVPVSALHLHQQPYSACCICSAFHHFDRQEAAAIVRSCVRNRRALFIMEPFRRDFRHLLLVVLSGPFPYMLAPFFAKPFTWKKLLLCTILPVFPLMVMIDGCISVLRVYRHEELRTFVSKWKEEDLTVEYGEHSYMGWFRSYYFYILPKPPVPIAETRVKQAAPNGTSPPYRGARPTGDY